MALLKGKMKLNIILDKSNCYFLKNGKCSLDIINDLYMSSSITLDQNDLLYCPQLYFIMTSAQTLKPVSIIPCECGHGEVINAVHRVCIASKKDIELELVPLTSKIKERCLLCTQEQSEENLKTNSKNVPVRVLIDDKKIK